MKQRIFFLMLAILALCIVIPELDASLQLSVAGDVAAVSGMDAVLQLDTIGDGIDVAVAAGPAFAALKWKMGQNNMGGYRGHVLFIPEDAVATAPVVPKWDAATDNKDLITAKGAFAFTTASGVKQPFYMYSTDGKVGYKAEEQGETDGKSYLQTLTLFYPGNTPEAHAFAALVKNTRGYYIFEDVDGQQFLLGQPGMCATTSVSYNGGEKRADLRGHSFTITCDSNYSAILMGTPVDIRKIGGYENPVAV